MRSMPSTRPPRAGLTTALTLAVLAGAAAAAASFVPSPFTIAAVGAAAFVVVAAPGPRMISRKAVEPVLDDARAAGERLAKARRELHDERSKRSILRELDRGLDQAANEREGINLLREAFTRHFGQRSFELHLVDAVDPVLTLTIATGPHESKPGERTSPWDSLAARTNTTLTYDTTDRLDICTHLQSRLSRPVAAIAVPLNATGRLLGVLYVFAEDGTIFSADETTHIEDLAAIVAGRMAVLRSVATGGRADAIDRLTGLPDRAAMQERVIRLLEERQSFTVAVADIDSFGVLNDQHGREVGDRALQTAGQVARRAIRPDDIVGRIGGDELLFIFPRTSPDDATRALERLREELVLAQSMADDPNFTLSMGVISSTSGGTIEEILHRAAGALNHAREQGGNRVVVAQRAAHDS